MTTNVGNTRQASSTQRTNNQDNTLNQQQLQVIRSVLSALPPEAKAAVMAWVQQADPQLAQALTSGANYFVQGSGSYQDESAGKAVEHLKNAPTPIDGKTMENAINRGTGDLDNQAAGKEFADLKKFATENWDKLSPDAKEKFRTYEKYAESAQARGMTGIPQNEYKQMQKEMHGAGYKDASSGAAVEGLKSGPKPVSGDAMQDAIINATKDPDNQAAGKEYADLKKFATENWSQMTPEAQAKFNTYEKYAKQSQAKGQTGMSEPQYKKMVGEMKVAGYQDKSAGAEIAKLKDGPQPVSGAAMEKAILEGTGDLDNQAAGKEFADFKKYATENWDKLSPDAKAKFATYEKYANAAQAKGQTGIPTSEYDKMKKEMKTAAYQDQSAGGAIENLKNGPRPISGDAMQAAIVNGTADLDNQAAGKEFADFKKFATENWDQLSPDAKAKFNVYEKFANAAQAKGQTGINQADYARMVNQMNKAGYADASSGAAVEGLKKTPAPVSGQAMEDAIKNGTADLDNQAAGKEFADFKKYATENWDKLSPDAKAKFSVYEKYANASQAKGQTGIPQGEYNKMLGEMKTAGYKDAGAGKAIEDLKAGPKPVSGQAMDDMILKATEDLDNQAAGNEFADIKKFAQENWGTLSPEAKAKYGVYEKYASAAQAKGQTGIAPGEYAKMIGEMRTTNYRDTSAGAAIEDLKKQRTPISGPAMEDAIKNATADLDNQAAGAEYADLKQFVSQNWDKLSPDAKAKFSTYEKYAQSAQARGMTGIPQGEYNQMLGEMHKAGGYADAGAGKAIEDLKRGPQPVSGAAMREAIINGTADMDNQAAGKEFSDFKKYATENWNTLSPEAKQQFRIYEKYASAAQAGGQTGIQVGDYARMMGEMNRAKYSDAGAGAALENLQDRNPGRIGGQSFERAIIEGTADLDNQAAGKEFADIKRFAEQNWDRMSPGAQKKFEIYSAYASKAQAQGQTGISQADYARMLEQMRRVRD